MPATSSASARSRFWIAVGSLVIMAGWSLATGTYFAFHDDVLSRLIARQEDQQFAYEDRIAELRAQVDRITSRQLLEPGAVRAEARAGHAAASHAGVARCDARRRARSGPHRLHQKPPGPDGRSAAGRDPEALADQRHGHLYRAARPRSAAGIRASCRRQRGVSPPQPKPSAVGVEGTLARLQASLDRVEARQTASLNTLEERFDSKAKRIRGVLADLGMDGKKAPAGVQVASVGGPFVPLTLRKDAGGFERQLYRIHVARANVEKLTRTLGAVPVRKPIMGEIDLSSGFGVRSDPFLGRPAMHTGLDFRSSTGDPVRATATGVVESAGYNGGYGKMVEIDHGNGFSTRYGHMSEIEVKVGQQIKIGQIIGRVGSTGRSTGPHLHYETRIDGDAVDPQKFLRAGLRLGNAL